MGNSGTQEDVEFIDIVKDRYQGRNYRSLKIHNSSQKQRQFHFPSLDVRDLNREMTLLLIGGRDEESGDSVEVLTKDGPCHTVEGFPAPLPAGLIQ